MNPAQHLSVPVKSLVFIDAGVPNYQNLCDGIRPDTKVFILHADTDGIAQITNVLSKYSQVESVHIVSHGAPATLYLGNAELSLNTLNRYSWDLQTWFTTDAQGASPQLLLYGCNVAAGDAGAEFLQKLRALTGATLYASAHPVGNSTGGSNWELEVCLGDRRLTPSVFDTRVFETYSGVFGTGVGSDGNYRWVDSKEPGGAGYVSFTDISSSGTLVSNRSDDDWLHTIALPFQFNFYGTNFSQISIANNGALLFNADVAGASTFSPLNTLSLPSSNPANKYGIFPFWDDLKIGQVYTATLGSPSNRRFVIQWTNMPQFFAGDATTFEVVLYEGSNNIDFVYQDAFFNNANYDYGRSATIGLNGNGAGVSYSIETPSLNGVSSVRFFTDPRLINNTLTLNEGQTVTLNSSNLSVTDIDNNDPSRLRFDVSNVQNGQFLLNGASITNFTLADVNAGKVQFAHDGGEAAPSYSVVATDGVNSSAIQAATISFTNSNDIPVLTDVSSTVTFNENALNIGAAIVDSVVTLTDVDSANFDSGRLTVSYSSGGSAQDQLSIQSGGSISLTGRDISFNGVLIGSIDAFSDGTNGKSLIVNFTNTNATVAAVQAVIASLGYKNISNTPVANRTISITVNDGDGGTSVAVPVAIAINADNDAPINTVPATQTIQEDTPFTFTGSTQVSISDPDAGSAPVRVTLNVTNGTVSLSNQATLIFTTGDGIDDSSLIFTGDIATINNALNNMVFRPTANFNGAASVQIITDDRGNSGNGSALSDTDIINFTVEAINDAPLNTVPVAQSVNEDSNLSFGTATSNAIRITDVDALEGTGQSQVTLYVTKGALSLAQNAGLSFSEGDGVGDAIMTFTGTQADINNALNGLLYRGNQNFNGTDTLTITTSDLGNTGSGGIKTDTDTVSVTVNAVNDDPLNTIPVGQIANEDTDIIFSTANSNAIVISDVDVSEGTGQLQVSLSVSKGTLTLSQIAGLNFSEGDGTGDALMTFTGNLANINAALNGLAYRGNLNFNGSDTLTIQTNDQGNRGLGGSKIDSDSVDITVRAVNDAPVLTDFVGVATFGENAVNATPAVIDNVVTVVDVDSTDFDGGKLAVTYNIGGTPEDQLSIRNQGTSAGQIGFDGTTVTFTGVSVGTIDAASKGRNGNRFVINFNNNATINAVTALIQNLTYQNTSDTPIPSRTIAITIDDGDGGISLETTAVLNVTAENDAPILVNNSLTISEGQTVVLNATNLSATDVDNDPASLVFTIGNLQNGEFRVNGTVANSFTQAQLAAGQVRFIHNGGEAAPVYNVSVGDGKANTTASAVVPVFTNVNDAPVLAGFTNTVTFIGKNIKTASAIIDDNVTLTDVDSNDFNGGKLIINYTSGGSAEDQLSIVNQGTNAGQIGLNGSTVTFGGTVIGSVDANANGKDGKSFIVNLNGSANAVSVRALIQNLSYQNTADIPIENRTIAIALDDGDGDTSIAVETNIVVTAENNPPVISIPQTLTINEDEPPLLNGASRISVNDTDAGDKPLRVTLTATQGAVTLSAVTGLSFATGDGTDDATTTFTGSLVDINRALDGMLFIPTANFNGAASLQVAANDQGNSGFGGAKTDVQILNINVSAVNDAPVIGVPETQSVQEDTVLAFVDNKRIAITDVDAENNPMWVSLSVNNGVISLSQSTGLTFSTGDGVNDTLITFTGTLADVNAALNGLTYKGNANYHGFDSLILSTSDQNASVSGGVGTDTKTLGLIVTAVNDAPENTVPGAQSVNEDANLVFSTAQGNAIRIGDLDIAEGTGLAKVTLATNRGGLTLAQKTGLTFLAGDGSADSNMSFTGTIANINAALNGLVYLGNRDFNGVDTLTITTSDEGNTGSGGAQVDTDAVTINVRLVNDAPVLSGTPATSVYEKNVYSFTPTVQDVDGDVLTFAIANKPGWATFDPKTGQLSGQPGDADVGTTSGIAISVSDGTRTVGLPAFNLTVIDNDVTGTINPDLLQGTGQNNTMTGQQGNDTILGLDGDDVLYGDQGNDLLQGGTGNDIMYGNDGNDLMTGDDGQDVLYGGKGNDRMFGGGGDDLLSGSSGKDFLDGGEGNDRLLGGDGNDILIGGNGDDLLDCGGGRDTVQGGAGQDTFVLHRDNFVVVRDFRKGSDKLAIAGVNVKRLFSQFGLVQRGKNTFLEFQNETLAKLVGIQADSITKSDFVTLR